MLLKNIHAVSGRELRRMSARPVYFFGTVFTFAFCALFFLTLLHNGLPMKLPVGLVDHDRSSISRRFYRELNAHPGLSVAYYPDYRRAREAMQEGEIFGFLELPEGLYSDLLSNRQPEAGLYANQAFLVPGTLAYKNFLSMANLASGAVQREVLRAKGVPEREIMGLIQPILLDNHYIGNPWSHYGVYLINVILPGILQLIILLMTIFPIGYELKSRTGREWLEAAGGSMKAALIGKLLPYTLLYSVLAAAMNILLYKVMHYPLQSSSGVMFGASLLLIPAAQAIGIFMIGLFPVLRGGISFAALYGIISISLAGMTFPLEYMPGPIRMLGEFFPLRHYYLIYVQRGIFGGSFGLCWTQYAALLLFAALPLTVVKRLKKALIRQNYPLK